MAAASDRQAMTATPMARALCALAACWALAAHAAPDTLLGVDDARLLLTRTGFGATPAEIVAFSALSRHQAVDRLLDATITRAVAPPPPELTDPATMLRPARDAADGERKAFRRRQRDAGLALRAWWLREMLVTPSPLTERMTLFWHGHFASSQQKVKVAALMYRQNVTLRANAVGNFGTLLHAVAKDPAMLVYLDTVQNRRGHANENFAREVMELFTLGEGHYAEQDIREAARAFTGWSIERDSGTYLFRPRLHDAGIKTVFGKSGSFDGDDVLDLILARPETARFITTALWRELVSPEPDAAAVERIAARFRDAHYDIKALLRAVLEDDAFYAAAARGTLVRSPADLVAGTLRTLDIVPANMLPYAIACAGMGQNLFSPPNVRGWPGGDAWINTNTLLARKQFLERIARADNFGEGAAMAPAPEGPPRRLRSAKFDADAWMAQVPHDTGADSRARALRMLLPIDAVDAASIKGDVPGVVRAALQDPVYQLE
ncbi:MAG: DUF1800 domain-containing protein [Betaproteobacteria bacterium]